MRATTCALMTFLNAFSVIFIYRIHYYRSQMTQKLTVEAFKRDSRSLFVATWEIKLNDVTEQFESSQVTEANS